jgi:hypothetical protein
MAVEEIAGVDAESDAKTGHTLIELNKRGEVVRIRYPDGSARFFFYDSEGGVSRIEDEAGRCTIRNDDYTWTTTARTGRKLGTSDKAYVTVSRDGNVVWGYYRTGTIVIQRTDCSSVKTTNTGILQEYISVSRRRFIVIDGGKFAETAFGEEDSIEEIALESLCAQHWELMHYIPTKEQIAKEVWCLLRDNRVANTENIEPGTVFRIPLPQL